MGAGDLEDALREIGEIFGFQTQAADWIECVGVEAGTQEDKLGLEFVGRLFECAAKGFDVLPAGDTKRERHVAGKAETGTGAGLFIGPGARVKAAAETVNAQEILRGIGVEDILRAVTVMHIPVDDQHAIEPVLLASMCSRDGDVVEKAKTHTGFRRRVMSGRPNQAECSVIDATNDVIDCGHAGTGSIQGDLEGRWRNNSVRIQIAAAAFGQEFGAFVNLRLMNSENRFSIRWRKTPCAAAAQEVGVLETLRNPAQAFSIFRVVASRVFEKNLITTVPRRYEGAHRRVYPGFIQLSAFITMNLSRHVRAHMDLFSHILKGELAKADANRKFYDEYFSIADLPAEFYLETVQRVFQEHHLSRGVYTWRNRKVDPRAIRKTSLLTVEGERDDICGLGQTMAAQDLMSSVKPFRKKHYVQPGVGHYGVFSGTRWHTQIYPIVRSTIMASD
ncbi:hypothetical protein BH10PLA2_BH10PLA2_12010 [soil metagenome]